MKEELVGFEGQLVVEHEKREEERSTPKLSEDRGWMDRVAI